MANAYVICKIYKMYNSCFLMKKQQKDQEN